jgi:hypothetical protein
MSWVQKLHNKILCQLLRNSRYYYYLQWIIHVQLCCTVQQQCPCINWHVRHLAASSVFNASKNVSSCSAISSSPIGSSSGRGKCSNTLLKAKQTLHVTVQGPDASWPTPYIHSGIHRPCEYCHLLGSLHTALQEVVNYTNHPLHLYWLSLQRHHWWWHDQMNKLHFTKQLLWWVFWIFKLLVQVHFSFVCVSSWGWPQFSIICFLWWHLNARMIPKSKASSWLVQLAGRNTTLMLLGTEVFSSWAA